VSSALPTCLAPITFTSSLLSSVVQPDATEGETPAFLYNMLDVLYGLALCRSIRGQLEIDVSEISRAEKLLQGNFKQMLEILSSDYLNILCEEAIDK